MKSKKLKEEMKKEKANGDIKSLKALLSGSN